MILMEPLRDLTSHYTSEAVIKSLTYKFEDQALGTYYSNAPSLDGVTYPIQNIGTFTGTWAFNFLRGVTQKSFTNVNVNGARFIRLLIQKILLLGLRLLETHHLMLDMPE